MYEFNNWLKYFKICPVMSFKYRDGRALVDGTEVRNNQWTRKPRCFTVIRNYLSNWSVFR